MTRPAKPHAAINVMRCPLSRLAGAVGILVRNVQDACPWGLRGPPCLAVLLPSFSACVKAEALLGEDRVRGLLSLLLLS
jgi:hypothetical protein